MPSKKLRYYIILKKQCRIFGHYNTIKIKKSKVKNFCIIKSQKFEYLSFLENF